MKKKLALIAAAMVLAMSAVSLTACGDSGETVIGGADSETGIVVTDKAQIADAADALNRVWAAYGEEEKFAAMGGDYTTPVDNAAGLMNVADTETVASMLQVPAEQMDKFDEAASLLHAMNANVFTGAAYHMTDTANADDFAADMATYLPTVQWLCGAPESLVIAKINGGEYVVVVYGSTEQVSSFEAKMHEVYGDHAAVVTTAALA